jgi:hypothetical protein
LKSLEGMYETYKGTMRGKVLKRGSLLTLETGDKFRDVTVSLLPVEWSGDVKRFEGISGDRKQIVEFYGVGDELFVIYERYKMKRVGKI